jgi:Na+-translocating ferredoxin:NAD+ oxidoreductase RnfC subunit
VQESLFIAIDYLGFKIRKLGFSTALASKNKLRAISARICALVVHEVHEAMTTLSHALMAHGHARVANEAALMCEILHFLLFLFKNLLRIIGLQSLYP